MENTIHNSLVQHNKCIVSHNTYMQIILKSNYKLKNSSMKNTTYIGHEVELIPGLKLIV